MTIICYLNSLSPIETNSVKRALGIFPLDYSVYSVLSYILVMNSVMQKQLN